MAQLLAREASRSGQKFTFGATDELVLLLLRRGSFAIAFAALATPFSWASTIGLSTMLHKASFLSPGTEILSHIIVCLDVDGFGFIVLLVLELQEVFVFLRVRCLCLFFEILLIVATFGFIFSSL